MDKIIYTGSTKRENLSAAIISTAGELEKTCVKTCVVESLNHETNRLTVSVGGDVFKDVPIVIHTDVGHGSYLVDDSIQRPENPASISECATRMFIGLGGSVFIYDHAFDYMFHEETEVYGENEVNVMFDDEGHAVAVVGVVKTPFDIVFSKIEMNSDSGDVDYFKLNNRRAYFPYLLIRARIMGQNSNVSADTVYSLYDLLREEAANLVSEDGESVVDASSFSSLDDFEYVLKKSFSLSNPFEESPEGIYHWEDSGCIQVISYSGDPDNEPNWDTSDGFPYHGIYRGDTSCDGTSSGAIRYNDYSWCGFFIPKHAGGIGESGPSYGEYGGFVYPNVGVPMGGELSISGHPEFGVKEHSGLYLNCDCETTDILLNRTGDGFFDSESDVYDSGFVGLDDHSECFVLSSNTTINSGNTELFYEKWNVYSKLAGGYMYRDSWWRWKNLQSMSILHKSYDMYDQSVLFSKNEKFNTYLNSLVTISDVQYVDGGSMAWPVFNHIIIESTIVYIPYDINERKLGLVR